jgi:hypothetical protein
MEERPWMQLNRQLQHDHNHPLSSGLDRQRGSRQPERLDLGPGIDGAATGPALECLCALQDALAVVAFGSQASRQARADSDRKLDIISPTSQLLPDDIR